MCIGQTRTMDCKLAIFLLLAIFAALVSADFGYNHPSPREEDLKSLGLSCLPGRTVIKLEDIGLSDDIINDKKKWTGSGSESSEEYRKPKPNKPDKQTPEYDDPPDDHHDDDGDDDDDDGGGNRNDNGDDEDVEAGDDSGGDVDDAPALRQRRKGRKKVHRRSHMNFQSSKDESCKVCVCSVEGKDEYCSRRPARNVNECLRLADIMENFQKNVPYDADSVLAYRIRRGQGGEDYVWHDDEIPYEPDAKCQRGRSYYTNDENANNTDIDKASSLESLLDYTSNNTCVFCICSTAGRDIACIDRNVWFCEYYRFYRQPGIMRDEYRLLFGQDRPTYFQTMSWRMRRVMDSSIYDLIDVAQDAVADKPGVSCLPFISQYSDCTEANQCTGCTRCTCTAEGTWTCRGVQECPRAPIPIDDSQFDNAMQTLYSELNNKNQNSVQSLVQSGGKSGEDLLLDANDEIEQKIVDLMNMPRLKREVDGKEPNGTVMFYNTVDELNEDTLKKSNVSGTLSAKREMGGTFASRRIELERNVTNNTDNPLKIENGQLTYNHIVDNKIDVSTEDPEVLRKKDIEIGIFSNQTQKDKDDELSKILVNELKVGKEIIGDKRAPVMSNITFIPENDTLTAMAFIAGNLLNKLWSMQKDASEEISTSEVEKLKHEKISDLIELFKDPLTIRQEIVLKNALEKLTEAMDQNKNPGNLTLCENIAEVKKLLEDARNITSNPSKTPKENAPCPLSKHDDKTDQNQKNITLEAISKISKVLEMIKKYETVNKHLNDLKQTLGSYNFSDPLKPLVDDPILSESDNESLNMFGNLLAKITKLLLPNQVGKKLARKITKQKVFTTDEEKLKEKIKKLYKYDLGNSTLSVKDKLILDYLTKLESNPRQILDIEEKVTPKSRLSVEGDILLNLSEFFKIKSFVDLVKHLQIGRDGKKTKLPMQSPMFAAIKTMEDLTESYEAFTTEWRTTRRTENNIGTTSRPTTKKPVTTPKNRVKPTPTTEQTVSDFLKGLSSLEQDEKMVEDDIATEHAVTQMNPTTVDDSQRFANTKAKFKSHLKAILSDLVELQQEYGINAKDGELKLADALPCIYNILKADKSLDNTVVNNKPTTSRPTVDPANKVKFIFNTIKDNLHESFRREGRRSMGQKYDMFAPRPKSALVWERVVKGTEGLARKNTRRSENITPPKSYEEIKRMLDQIEAQSGSNTYKAVAMYRGVPHADRLVFLNTLYNDVKKYMNVLPTIKASLDDLSNLPNSKKMDIVSFVNDAANTIEMDSRVFARLDLINKTMPGFMKNFKSISSDESNSNTPFKLMEDIRRPSHAESSFDKSYRVPAYKSFPTTEKPYKPMLINRDDVVIQLVKNKIEAYIKKKQERGDKKDVNYNIAKNILQHIELGNFEVARELYKVFASATAMNDKPTAKPAPIVDQRQVHKLLEPLRVNLPNPRRESIADKVPLVDFDDLLLGNRRAFDGSMNRDYMLKQLLDFKNLKLTK